jgi:hypothetical protein
MSASTMGRTLGNAGAVASAQQYGSPKGFQKLPNFTPEMMQLFQSLFGQLGPNSRTARLAGGDESIFNEIEAPEYSKFTSGLGGLASKFSGMGGTGARRSSGFQNAGNQALSEFSQGLASQRQSLSSQALKDLFSMSNMLLSQRPFEYREEKQEPDWFTKLLGYGGDIASIFSQFVPGGGGGGGASRQQQYQGF